jgi:sulfite exporter TauE/SafE/copper chaperone CopZ
MKKVFKIEGMHCNSCAYLIENKLKDKVTSIGVSYSKGEASINFDEGKISEEEIKTLIEKEGYSVTNFVKDIGEHKMNSPSEERILSDKVGFWFMIGSFLLLAYFIYKGVSGLGVEVSIPEVGQSTGLILIFLAGILTGFHCISMCGAFVVSYTTKNAMNGYKGFNQHIVYGGAKLVSYAIIGGIFGLIGGIFAFSIGLRGAVAIFAGVFMIFYSLSMMGLKFFRKFQFNPKFLTRWTAKASHNAKGAYTGPFVTGILSGLFIACGPLQAMYLYAAGTGNFWTGFFSLAVFGLGTLPVMLGFGSLATVISQNTTKKILKVSAVIVLILGVIMLNRGLTVLGSPYSFSSIVGGFNGGDIGTAGGAVLSGDYQIVNMDVSSSGYSPNSFVIKRGVPVKWNVNVKQLTGCNSELVMSDYNINVRLKQGINTFEFTPNKIGTIRFSCGMGMLRGSFIVTEDGTATQEQIKTNTPAAGSTCGMGGSGGGCGCGG